MKSPFTVRQGLILALAATAVRPLHSRYSAVPAFVTGWLSSELAPQLLAITAADTAAEVLLRTRPAPLGLALAGASATLLGAAIRASARTRTELAKAFADSTGPGTPTLHRAAIAPAEVARPFALHDPAVEVLRNIGYVEGGRRAKLDIYRRAGAQPTRAPVLVQVHGGGWTIGSKEHQGLLLMNRLASQGWICVSVNYRLAPKHLFPAQIIDVKRAVAWVKEHIAEYGGDSDYVAITGGSAGGHLAALAALTPGAAEFQPGFTEADTSLAACVPFYGVYDLAGLTEHWHAVGLRDSFLAPRVFGKDPVADRADFVAASPLARIHPEAPDFFVLHGANDTLVSVEQARAFVTALRAQSRGTVTYAELSGANHAFETFSSIRSQLAVRAAADWLQWHHSTQQARRPGTGLTAR